MTIRSATRKSPLYVGSGSTGPFAFPFKVFAASEVVVTTSVIATGVETVLGAGEYTVTLNAEQDGNPGGSITLASALPATKNLVITSAVPLTQPVDINNQDGFFAEVIEDALDRAMIAAQQLKVDVDRAVKLPLTGTYQNPDALVNGVLESAADAEAAQVAAEAAQTAAETAQGLSEDARDASIVARNQSAQYAVSVQDAAMPTFTSLASAISSLGAGNDGDTFRVISGDQYRVYTYDDADIIPSPGSYGDLQYIAPVDIVGPVVASSASGGVSQFGNTIPASPIVDIVAVDGLYNPNQIRNRVVPYEPDLNLLGHENPSIEPLRSAIETTVTAVNPLAPPTLNVLFDYLYLGTTYDMFVNYAESSGGDEGAVRVANLFVPAGRWTLAFEAQQPNGTAGFAGFDIKVKSSTTPAGSVDRTISGETAGLGTWTEHTCTFNASADDFVNVDLFVSNSSLAQIAFRKFRLIPGASASYTQPAERHAWHRRAWTADSGKIVFKNDDVLKDNLHLQVPFAQQKTFEEVTFSLAFKSSSNRPGQAINVTTPSTSPFSILLTPAEQFAVGGAGGYIGFNSLGSTDDVVQVGEVALPLDKWAVLTVVCPKEQGLSSDPTRIYMNGIQMRNVEDVIRIKTATRTDNGSGKILFNFGSGKAHNFVEGQPVTVTVADDGLTTGEFPDGLIAGRTYYVRLPAVNPQETLLLSETVTGDLIDWVDAGAGFVFIQSQRRPVGTVPFVADTLSIMGSRGIEKTDFDFGGGLVISLGLNMEGEFASVTIYDKALTDAEVQNLVAVQKQRIASHYEQVASLGSVLLTEGDSITFGVGAEASQTFRYRLFYGMNFNEQTTSSFSTSTNPKTTNAITNESGDYLFGFAAAHNYSNGDIVRVSGTLPTGLSAGTDYYVELPTASGSSPSTTLFLSETSGGPRISHQSPVPSQTIDFAWNEAKMLFSYAAAHGYAHQVAVTTKSSNTLPSVFSENIPYYIRLISSTSFCLAPSGFGPAFADPGDGIGSITTRLFTPGLDNDAEKLNAINFATSGSLISDTLARRNSVVAMIEKVVAEGSRPIVIYMAGMNDLIFGLGGAPLDATKINLLGTVLQDIWTSYRNAGAKLIVCTVTAANENDIPFDPLISTGFYTEALRSQLNDKIRSLSAYYDALADLGATAQVGTWQPPFIGTPPAVNPASYFFDNIHPDFQGHIVMSNILSPLVDAFRL